MLSSSLLLLFFVPFFTSSVIQLSLQFISISFFISITFVRTTSSYAKPKILFLLAVVMPFLVSLSYLLCEFNGFLVIPFILLPFCAAFAPKLQVNDLKQLIFLSYTLLFVFSLLSIVVFFYGSRESSGASGILYIGMVTGSLYLLCSRQSVVRLPFSQFLFPLSLLTIVYSSKFIFALLLLSFVSRRYSHPRITFTLLLLSIVPFYFSFVYLIRDLAGAKIFSLASMINRSSILNYSLQSLESGLQFCGLPDKLITSSHVYGHSLPTSLAGHLGAIGILLYIVLFALLFCLALSERFAANIFLALAAFIFVASASSGGIFYLQYISLFIVYLFLFDTPSLRQFLSR